MKDTYIEKIDNVDEITAYISYEEYLCLPAFRQYMAENNIPLPKRCIPEEEEKPVEEKKKKVNGSSIGIIVFGLLFVAWCAIGVFMKDAIFALYGGEHLFKAIAKLLTGEYTEVKDIIAVVAITAAIILELAFVIVAFTEIGKEGTSKAIKAGTFLAFVAVVVAAVMSIMVSASVNMGIAVAMVLAVATFFVSLIGRKNIQQ